MDSAQPPVACSRVLLVEDNPDHALLASLVLQQLLGDSMEMIHAENALEAVELISEFGPADHPDLMLIDLRLPLDGGLDVLAAIRANAVCASVPSFVLTASEWDQDIAMSYQLGASAVLHKPLSRRELRDELNRWCLVSEQRETLDEASRG